MQRKLISILAGGTLLFAAAGSAFAQGESGGAGTSGGATSGGATSGGATAPAPAPEAPPPAPIPPGPVAPPAQAPFLSDTALIGIGAAALLAGVLIAVTQSSSHTVSTTATSH